MSLPERKLSGIFQLFKNIQFDSAPSAEMIPEPTEMPEFVPFWRASLTRKELLAWFVLPSLPLGALLRVALSVDIRWDGKPTTPYTPTPFITATPTATPPKPTSSSSLITIPTSVATPTPSPGEIRINSR